MTCGKLILNRYEVCRADQTVLSMTYGDPLKPLPPSLVWLLPLRSVEQKGLCQVCRGQGPPTTNRDQKEK